MKQLLTGLITLTSLSVFAKGPHQHDQQMRSCLEELRGTQEMSQECKDFFQKKEERRAKLKECMAAIDGATSLNTSTDANTTTDSASDSTSDTTATSDTQSVE